MLDHTQLVQLYREHREARVLSVYLDAGQHDPALRKVWRTRLETELSRVRRELEATEDRQGELPSLEAATSAIGASLDRFDGFLPGAGWAGFASADGLLWGDTVHAPMPDLVRWEDGIRVAPYIRALKQSRPVVVALADSRRARLLEYRDGSLEEFEELHADTHLGDLTDVNVSRRATQRSGVRGQTGTDAAHDFLEVGQERMAKELVATCTERMGKDGILVLGGIPEVVASVAGAFPAGLGDRVDQRPSMHVGMGLAEIRAAIDAAASEITARGQAELVDEIVDLALSGRRGCLGRDATRTALLERRVDTLVLSRRFLREDPDLADHFVGAAFEEGASVQEIGGAGAERLDEEGDGAGARLRYRIDS